MNKSIEKYLRSTKFKIGRHLRRRQNMPRKTWMKLYFLEINRNMGLNYRNYKKLWNYAKNIIQNLSNLSKKKRLNSLIINQIPLENIQIIQDLKILIKVQKRMKNKESLLKLRSRKEGLNKKNCWAKNLKEKEIMKRRWSQK